MPDPRPVRAATDSERQPSGVPEAERVEDHVAGRADHELLDRAEVPGRVQRSREVERERDRRRLRRPRPFQLRAGPGQPPVYHRGVTDDSEVDPTAGRSTVDSIDTDQQLPAGAV